MSSRRSSSSEFGSRSLIPSCATSYFISLSSERENLSHASFIVSFSAFGVTFIFYCIFILLGVGTRPRNRGICLGALRLLRNAYCVIGAIPFNFLSAGIWCVFLCFGFSLEGVVCS
jgi:hypothetical protein